MWYAFIQLHIFLQRLYPLRFIYNVDTLKFEVTQKPSLIYAWVNSQIFCVWCLSAYNIIVFMRSQNATAKEFEGFVMDLLYWTLMVICLSIGWTLKYRREKAVWFMNEAMGLKKRADLKNKELSVPAIAMYSLGSLAFIFPVTLAALPFVFTTTPVNEMLRFALPSFIMKEKNVEVILSSLYWLIHGWLAVFNVTQLLAVVVVILYEAKFMMQSSYQTKVAMNSNSIHLLAIDGLQKKKITTTGEEKDKEKGKTEMKLKIQIQTYVKFPPALNVYRRTALLFYEAKQFGGKVLFTSMIFVGFLLNVVFKFAIIRLNDQLPLLVVVMLAGADIVIMGNTFTYIYFAVIITTEYEKFVKFWKGKLIRKVYQKQLLSCKIIQIWIGNFFPVEMTTSLSSMNESVNMTATLLCG
ncbi:unnamed protein product [Orchesella dallaii]|uniref:Odorant receptor n=1 Tax=Orchesella dallaii TaxID=48710 RepID=A0ABP1QN08_9HEXA